MDVAVYATVFVICIIIIIIIVVVIVVVVVVSEKCSRHRVTDLPHETETTKQ